ncbi:MAG: glycerol-3-phosphate 1-O-acyltransferase PlsY [Ketobacteraceae bacterium]|nr:glycerol-3-phosphate 1-O-acyltransferase PlsY [Ketobacteraceae bacterium]
MPVTLWLLSYLVGSVSSAILICRLLGLPDPREEGSHNPGATNVLRVGGKVAGALTLLGDVGKGVLPVYLSLMLHPSATVAALCGVFAFIGHCYPVYFDFRGGKGVATAFGVLAMLHWPSALFTGALWVSVFALTRVSSLASLISWTLAPFALYFFADTFMDPLLILIAILIYRHYPNLFLLAKGKEHSFTEPSKNHPDSPET